MNEPVEVHIRIDGETHLVGLCRYIAKRRGRSTLFEKVSVANSATIAESDYAIHVGLQHLNPDIAPERTAELYPAFARLTDHDKPRTSTHDE